MVRAFGELRSTARISGANGLLFLRATWRGILVQCTKEIDGPFAARPTTISCFFLKMQDYLADALLPIPSITNGSQVSAIGLFRLLVNGMPIAGK